MSAYINNYELQCNAGDTQSLMHAIYAKKTAVSIDTEYMDGVEVGLGKMEYEDFFATLESVVSRVLSESNLENFHNTLLIVGSSVGGMQESEQIYFKEKSYKNITPSRHAISVLGDFLLEKFHFLDARSLSTACTSSANALLLAKRLIEVHAYENILVVGADALCYTTVCGFHALSVLSSRACQPFDTKRSGMNVAEAVAALLIQNQKTENSLHLAGAGASSDAFHMTNPHPEAQGAIASMQAALRDAGIEASEIDYINAHGTATEANDRVEALAVATLFANKSTTPYVSSTKAITGHTLGAAGALEAIICCEAIKQSLIPPQTALCEAENLAINIPKEAIHKELHYVLSNSFAFGGNNTSLVLGLCK